jgi:hypothetical protein
LTSNSSPIGLRKRVTEELATIRESASEIGLTRRLGEEEYCKNRARDGAILAVPVRMADRRECSDRKIVSQCRAQARWAYNGVVFEVKKEIPD